MEKEPRIPFFNRLPESTVGYVKEYCQSRGIDQWFFTNDALCYYLGELAKADKLMAQARPDLAELRKTG